MFFIVEERNGEIVFKFTFSVEQVFFSIKFISSELFVGKEEKIDIFIDKNKIERRYFFNIENKLFILNQLEKKVLKS